MNYHLFPLNRGSSVTSCWKIDSSSSKLYEIKVKQVFFAFFGFFPNIRLILEIFCAKNQSQKSFKLVKKWNFLHLFTFLWSNLCVRGPNHFILVFFPLDLLSNIKYFMKKTFLNYHLFPLKGAVNLWNDIKTLYTVFFFISESNS